MMPLRTLVLLVAMTACVTGDAAPPDLRLDRIVLPAGFEITLYAADVPNARSLALSPEGTLFIGTRQQGSVYAVRDDDGDGTAETSFVLAEGLNMPNGVALRDGNLFVAEVSRILRFDDIENRLADPPEPVVVYDGLPSDTWHGWKYIAFGPDEMLYVPVGAPCNVCEREAPYASILRMSADGGAIETVARGVRNTVGFDWHPQTNELWFTDNGRDMMGDDIPPDELNRAEAVGRHFGFPYFHGGDIADPEFGEGKVAGDFTPPARKLGPHVAALGMEFYTGMQFPDVYRNQIFIAEHGSWNRSKKIGYRVSLVRIDSDGAVLSYAPFAEGWLQDEESWGRPVDLELMPDGSLLVSDDQAGVVYRISYTG